MKRALFALSAQVRRQQKKKIWLKHALVDIQKQYNDRILGVGESGIQWKAGMINHTNVSDFLLDTRTATERRTRRCKGECDMNYCELLIVISMSSFSQGGDCILRGI